jgi:hypothetical protein
MMAAVAACSPYVERGETLYHEGRYIEAAEVFELTEQRLAAAPPVERAEYGLYRGLTFLRLSDLASARQWLGYTNGVEQSSPGSLTPPEHVALGRGWSELEQRAKSQPGLVDDGPRVASGDATLPSRAPAGGNGRRAIAPQ